MTQWLESFKRALRSYWPDVLLLILAVGAPVISSWLSYRFDNPVWFQRSGSLTVLFAAVLEYRQATIDEKAREAAWGAAKRRSWAGTPIVGHLPPPRRFFVIAGLLLIVPGTIIWGYGDLLFSIVSAP